jgi:hypothetical protein
VENIYWYGREHRSWQKKKKMINLGYFNIVGLDVQKGEFYGSAIFPAQKNKKRNEDGSIIRGL